MDRETMEKAQKIRRKILELARDENVESDVLMLAIADVIGDVAAMCDRCVVFIPFERRVETLIERARLTYGRVTGGGLLRGRG